MTSNILTFNDVKYLLKFPEGYVKGEKYPVLFFLHGAGSRGENINNLISNPFFEITNKHNEFPFIVVAPLCNRDTWFDMFDKIISLLELVSHEEYADNKKIYGIGASMGGYGVWQLAMSKPDVFAGIIPICGGGMYWNAERLKNIPIWAFHGEKDTVVLVEESKKMVNAVNNLGGNATLTIYPENGHDAWSDTYENYAIFEWLLQNKQSCKPVSVSDMPNNKLFG